MEKQKFLTDHYGNPSSMRRRLERLFWFAMLLLLADFAAHIFKPGHEILMNMHVLLLLMVFFPQLVYKFIELRFPALKDQIKGALNPPKED